MYKKIQLFRHQSEFVGSKARHTILVCGFGAGKTQSGVVKTIIKLITTPKNIDCGFYLPTYGLIHSVAIPRFEEILTEMDIKFKLNISQLVFKTRYGKIILRNMSKPSSIIGFSHGYANIDEADTLPQKQAKAVFNKIIARNRQILPNGEQNQLDITTTPEGFGFVYNFAVKEASEDKLLIQGKTSDNKFLPSEYIKSLEAQYTAEELNAYVNGIFCNLTSGTVYKSYKRDKYNTNRIALHNEPLYIGMDFNIEKMSAIVYVIDGGAMYAVDQIINKYDTEDLANAIREVYPTNEIEINPDASCRARSSAGLSDYDILIDEKYNFNVNARRKNPEISHRIRAVNKSFEIGKLFVNLEKCPALADALEQQAYDKGLPDKKSGVDHILDACGYCVVEQIYRSGLD